jgi:predicted  nucleic acid-binding Zn-ribbon protein
MHFKPALRDVLESIQGFRDEQCDMRDQLTQLTMEIRTMSQGISQLDTEITALQAQSAALQNTLTNVSENILAAVQSIQSKQAAISGSAPVTDLTTEVASLTKIGTDLGVVASNLSGLQTQVDAFGDPVNPAQGTSSASAAQPNNLSI